MRLIIDTDPGVDDAIAIALAHAMDGVELVALTTIFGNTFVAQSSRNARFLLDMLGLDAPVAEGADLPYDAVDYAPSANVHGPEGFGAMAQVPDIGVNASETAAEFLAREARTGDLVICAIGPLTNIADALRLDPDFASNVAELVIMGGAFEVPGNITPAAEANIFHDAKAADEVFASGLKVTMIGLNATMQSLMTPDDFQSLADTSSKVGGFLNQISEFYLGFYRSVGVTDGCPMHDAAAVLACTDPNRFTFVEAGLRVVLEGDDIGATVADTSRPPARVAVAMEGAWAVDKLKSEIAKLP